MIAVARDKLRAHPAWTVFVIALVARIAYAARSGPILGADSVSYHAAANALRSSLFTHDPTFLILPPMYPVYVAILPDDRIALAVQLIISAGCAALILRATARHLGSATGWIAGVLIAFQPTLVFWATYILSDTLAVAFFALALDLASLALARPRPRTAAAGGAATALLLLTRAAYTLAIVPLVVAHALRARSKARAIAAFVAAVLVVLALPAARNAVAIGQPSVYDGQLWTNLWIGVSWTETGRATTGVDLVPPESLKTATPAERQEYFKDVALTFIRERPVAFVVLTLKKGLWYVLPAYPEWSTAHKLITGGYLTLSYLLAVIGAIAARRSAYTWMIVACAAAFVVTAMLTYVDFDARYRLPFELTIVPLVAAGLLRVSRSARSILRSGRPAPA